ncbi:hypothetical protein [Kitasatospora sp. CB01950]|uniref:hypothetical protein n=1 Tax=Kitasatospora sp. CB01950 TaxID=1703930 RepID=UPI0009396E29|nr:hypothetical protein [Kitasatospora sp. CB01950]OKJ08299.1 hypothetical protein AMK19_20055 [Kitasatospora sp. CB01950]
MSQYQSQPLPTAAFGHYLLQRTAGEHLHPGEPMIGAWAMKLDRLAPLWWDRDIVRAASHAPLAWIYNFFVRFWYGFLLHLLPRWFVVLFMPRIYLLRPYGLSLTRRAYRAIRRPLHGGSLNGDEGTTAWQFWRAVRTTPGEKLRADHDHFTVLLTDRRLLVLARWTSMQHTQHYRAVPLYELPFGSWWLRPDTPNDVWAARQDLLFADGSWIALEFEDSAEREAFRNATAGR